MKIRVKSGHKAGSKGERLGIQRPGQIVHVEDVLAEAADVLTDIGTETGYESRRYGVPIPGHGR